MPGIIGAFTGRFERGIDNPALSNDLNRLAEVVSRFDSYESRPGLQGGYGTWRRHTGSRWAVAAQQKGSSFFDDFYNRIHSTPSLLDTGNLLSSQSRRVILWNSFLTPQTLESAGLGAQGGISLTLPGGVSLPYDLSPLEEVELTVRIEQSGPPNIDSTLEFTVAGVTYVVPIIGRRIIGFPFAPNWRSPVDETVTMRSWALTAQDGSEQTGSESGEVARRTLEYAISLRTSLQAQKCENLLFGWQSRFFGVPHWGEESYLDADVEAGDTEIFVDTFGMSIEVGSLIAIYRDETINEIREVSSFTANSVTVTTGFEFDWPQGARVYPCFVGILNDQLTINRESSRYGNLSVAFDFEPSVTPSNTALSAPPALYRGKELYLKKTNWIGGTPVVGQAEVQRIDYNVGRFSAYSSSGFSKLRRTHNWTLFTREEIVEFRKFLSRRQGVARSVYMPTGTEDFTLVDVTLDTEDLLRVETNEYARIVGVHPARRDIIIYTTNGQFYCRRIVNAEDSAGVTVLRIDAPFGFVLRPEDVERISFLTLYRFESPSTTLRFATNNKAVVEANLLPKMTEN